MWTYKDVSYRTLTGVIVAVLAHHGEYDQLKAVAAWAAMWSKPHKEDADAR
jgi:hypothetical protein